MRHAVLAVALLLVAAVPAAQAGKFRYTHRVVVTGHLVDHWTIDEPDECGVVGDGTVTVDFTSAKPAKAAPAISETHNGEPNNTLGSWVLFAPVDAFGHIGDMPSKPAVGTIDLVDNTTQRPRPEGNSDCGGIDKSGCGTHPLKKAQVAVSGYNRKLIQASLDGVQFSYATGPRVNCGLGAVDGFGSPPALAGGNRIGDLLIKMPKPSKLRRKVVTVTKTTNKKTTSGDPGRTTYTDDFTRTVTVTFTRIR
jgi:hypothetical protein